MVIGGIFFVRRALRAVGACIISEGNWFCKEKGREKVPQKEKEKESIIATYVCGCAIRSLLRSSLMVRAPSGPSLRSIVRPFGPHSMTRYTTSLGVLSEWGPFRVRTNQEHSLAHSLRLNSEIIRRIIEPTTHPRRVRRRKIFLFWFFSL